MDRPVCKICSCNTDLLRDRQYEIDYFYCRHCQFIFMDEKEIVSPEKEVALYKQHNNTLENEGYVNMFRRFIDKTIRPFQGRIKKVLDFGCGPGPVLAVLLREMGFEVDIYDPYFASEKVYRNQRYDLVTATEVFEHLKHPLETAQMLNEHLNPGGILAVMTLFHPGCEDEFNNWWYRSDPTHISFFQPQTFHVLAEKTGFRVVMTDLKNICVLEKAQ